MFMISEALGEFNSDLPKLKNGYQMFWSCLNLTTFNSDLRSLINGN